MKKPLIVGNWKMNLDRAAAVELAGCIAGGCHAAGEVELAVCPPAIYLDAVADVLKGSPVSLGAQNMYFEPGGAFTGEISAAMLVDIGCRFVILGHSERRHVMGETDRDVNRKLRAALDAGLTPIVCVGELLSQREAGQTGQVIRGQAEGSLAGLSADEVAGIAIAYEPVWAIGTGQVATPQQAEKVHSDLRRILAECYNDEVSAAVRIQYGGSVKPNNAGQLLGCPNIDGALVGGASLSADDFLGIAEAAGSG